MKNSLLYNASMALVECARIIRPVDVGYAQQLLDKAEEFKNQIVIDEKLDAEVTEFEKRIKEGL